MSVNPCGLFLVYWLSLVISVHWFRYFMVFGMLSNEISSPMHIWSLGQEKLMKTYHIYSGFYCITKWCFIQTPYIRLPSMIWYSINHTLENNRLQIHKRLTINNPACKLCGVRLEKMTLIARFMGPIWGRQDPGGPPVGPMDFAIWGMVCILICDKNRACCSGVCRCQATKSSTGHQ